MAKKIGRPLEFVDRVQATFYVERKVLARLKRLTHLHGVKPTVGGAITYLVNYYYHHQASKNID